jgi:hypothetical protein
VATYVAQCARGASPTSEPIGPRDANEAKLIDKVTGTSTFTPEVSGLRAARFSWTFTAPARLQRRLFRYPRSDLIYSAGFRELPSAARDYVWQRLWDILNSRDASKEFEYLSAADRQAVLEILRETHPVLGY